MSAETQRTDDKSDWTPIEALQFYADQKHFDVVDGRSRILDTGAVASNALKRASLEYAEKKGDVALEALSAAKAECAALRIRVGKLTGAIDRLHDIVTGKLSVDDNASEIASIINEAIAPKGRHAERRL